MDPASQQTHDAKTTVLLLVLPGHATMVPIRVDQLPWYARSVFHIEQGRTVFVITRLTVASIV